MLRTTLLFVLLLTMAACEVQTTRYDTVQMAREDRLFERGWVPNVLPDSARSIVETHNLDTNERCAQATIPTASVTKVDSLLLQSGFWKLDSHPIEPPFGGCHFQKPAASSSVSLYVRDESTMDGDSLRSGKEFAVLEEKNTFYFWSGKPVDE